MSNAMGSLYIKITIAVLNNQITSFSLSRFYKKPSFLELRKQLSSTPYSAACPQPTSKPQNT